MNAKRTAKKLDDQISKIFSTRCNGIAINVLDISKIFAAGRAAAADGADLETAVVNAALALRQN